MENRMSQNSYSSKSILYKLLYLTLFSGLISVSGCAVSPQSISLNPSITVDKKDIGRSRSIDLKVVDERPSKVLGTRGGIYSDTALLTINGGSEEPIRQELVGALSGYGFNMINSNATDIDMTIFVESLGYEILGKKFPKVIKNNILLRVKCNKKDKSFTSKYAASIEEEVLITPLASQNEKMINKIVSKALSAVVKDKKLLKFLN